VTEATVCWITLWQAYNRTKQIVNLYHLLPILSQRKWLGIMGMGTVIIHKH